MKKLIICIAKFLAFCPCLLAISENLGSAWNFLGWCWVCGIVLYGIKFCHWADPEDTENTTEKRH